MLKPIPDFPDYFASEGGEIYSTKYSKNPKPLKFGVRRKKYRYVVLMVNNRRIIKNIATLVLETFVSPRPKDMYACHGIKGSLVDSVDNLYWGTPKQNMVDKYRDSTQPLGEACGSHKLNKSQVQEIRQKYSRYGIGGESTITLAKIFSVSPETIRCIVLGKTWSHI